MLKPQAKSEHSSNKNSFHSKMSDNKLSVLSNNPAYEQELDELRHPPQLEPVEEEKEEVKDPCIRDSERNLFHRVQEQKKLS